VATLLLVNRTKANAEALATAFAASAPPPALVAAEASEARSVVSRCAPDVAVIELDVAVGLRLVRDLLRMHPALKVFIYGSTEDEREMNAWADAGAACIVLHSVSLADLVRSVTDAIRDGCRPAERRATVQGSSRTTSLVRVHVGPGDLTQREHDVLQLIGLGLSNREVAETLCLELPTVKNHVQHLMRKLGVHRRADAVRYLNGPAIAPRTIEQSSEARA
jgi:DNA-binding NarL/FixJ family response regulator